MDQTTPWRRRRVGSGSGANGPRADAKARVDGGCALVLRADLSDGEKDYVEALGLFIEDYDRRHNVFDTSGRTPLDMLTHLMEAHDMSVTDLGHLLGSKGIASEILHSKRSLSKSHILKLAGRFNVDPGLFLEKPTFPARGKRSHSV